MSDVFGRFSTLFYPIHHFSLTFSSSDLFVYYRFNFSLCALPLVPSTTKSIALLPTQYSSVGLTFPYNSLLSDFIGDFCHCYSFSDFLVLGSVHRFASKFPSQPHQLSYTRLCCCPSRCSVQYGRRVL